MTMISVIYLSLSDDQLISAQLQVMFSVGGHLLIGFVMILGSGVLTLAFRRPPNTLPLVGNGILFLQARHTLFSWFVECERQFGFETFQISIPSLPPGVVINDPKNLEYVLKNEGIFSKGDFFKRRSWDLFGTESLLCLPRFTYILIPFGRKWYHQCRW